MSSSIDGSDVKRCTACKHYIPGIYSLGSITFMRACTHPNNRSLVDGSCRDDPERLRYGYYTEACGKEGRWWEAKVSPLIDKADR